jgi:diguanylate cyclase (GGDEF)-like protein
MEELSDSLSNLFEREHDIEGENFTLCLDSEFFHIEEGDANLRTRGYNDEIAVVGTVRDGKKKSPRMMKKKDAIFYLAKKREVPDVYMYVPMYSDEKTYGFAVLTGDLEIVHNNRLYIWTRHMNQYLEQVRRNIRIVDLTERLTNLSVMDTLTGVYNRAGCERITYPMLEDWKEKGGLGAIFIVDIDKMKNINDQSGHANGDLALRTVASVLRAEMPRDWVVSRFGGDEFLVGGRVIDGEIDIEAICQAVQERLAKEVEKRGIEFRLTVSVGGVPIRPEDEFDIEKYLQMADEYMYRMKDKHHKIMEEE